jgi:hypothetical protein
MTRPEYYGILGNLKTKKHNWCRIVHKIGYQQIAGIPVKSDILGTKNQNNQANNKSSLLPYLRKSVGINQEQNEKIPHLLFNDFYFFLCR